MLNLKILGQKVQNYIQNHVGDKIPELVLKGSPFNEIKNILNVILKVLTHVRTHSEDFLVPKI